MQRLKQLLMQDPVRMRLLRLVALMQLPDAWLAAGFVRNLVWDDLHQQPSSPLNDVDVIFFDPTDVEGLRAQHATEKLLAVAPDVNWQVKNQALMHIRNHDAPYKSSTDAMGYWPEKETAVAVCLDQNENIKVSAPFGVDSLFKGSITHNTKRDKKVYLDRIAQKKWLSLWPNLKLANHCCP
jgi:hypothetical protein